jgi:hypothetical protein
MCNEGKLQEINRLGVSLSFICEFYFLSLCPFLFLLNFFLSEILERFVSLYLFFELLISWFSLMNCTRLFSFFQSSFPCKIDLVSY